MPQTRCSRTRHYSQTFEMYTKKKKVLGFERGANALIVTPLKYVSGLNKKVIDFFFQ